ncbi:fibronectin type III domain-containing protein 1 [Xenentodon cancila]
MALAASRTLLALFVTFCAPECGWTAEKLLRPQNGKQTSVDEPLRESWEPSIHLDGRPVDRFFISPNKPTRSHRFTKVSKDSRSHLLEDLDPEWVNLDGFAVLGNGPVSNSSAGSVRSSQTASRNHSTAERTTRVEKRAHPGGVTFTRTHRRAPQSSSGPRQPDRALTRTPVLKQRRQHSTKPQADQRNQHKPKLTSESVHVVSLQAQKAQGQSAPPNRAVAAKITTPEPPEYEARDINVRVMSPKSVLISWVDPAVEMGKVAPGTSRSYTVKFREKGESARWEYRTSTQRRLMIDTLYADSMYEFSVKISQGEKHSEWSASVFQRTPESAPSGPPENFEVKPLRGKGTAAIATWDPPEEPNGRIREYILSYAPAMKPFGMKSMTYRGSTATATIDGLTPGERYIFKIRATNRRGMGPQSKTFSVAMPQSSNAASSFTKNKDSQRTSQAASKQDIDQSTEALEESATTPQPRPSASLNRRLRPLSQTRSYHSIFSSVRGSVRNPVSRDSTRRKAKEEKDEDPISPTPSLAEQTTTTEVVPKSKEPYNDVSLVSEDEVGYDEPMTTEVPSLKILTPSPTKPVHISPQRPIRRPIKIRVHQKAGSKVTTSSSAKDSSSSTLSLSSSDTPSIPSASINSSSSFPSFSSSSSSSSILSTSSSHDEEPTTNKKDNVIFTYPEIKMSHNKPSLTQTKPTTTVVKETNSQQTVNTPMSKGSSGRRSGSTGLRYGYGRRQPGILLRGNSTRVPNGYKPAVTSQLNLPSRTHSQGTLGTDSSAKSQSTLPERTESTLNSQGTLDTYNFGKSKFTSESKPHGSLALEGINLSTSQSSAIDPSTEDTSVSSQRVSQASATSHEKHTSRDTHKSRDQDTTSRDGNYRSNSEVTEAEEPSLGIRTNTNIKDTQEEEGNDKSTNVKTIGSHTRISPSFAERFPWLASRYPGRFGSSSRATSPRQDSRTPYTRVSSSVGAGRPLLRGTTTRLSGAVGATEVSSLQETAEDLRTPFTNDALKNGIGSESFKPSIRNPTTSASTSLNSDSHRSSSGHTHSSEPVHKEASNVNSNDYKEDYVNKRIGEGDKKIADPAATQNNPSVTSAVQQSAEDNGTREPFSRTKPGTSSGVSPNYRRPGLGMNGRARSPLLTNRQSGGSRLPIRPQPAQNSRSEASTLLSSSSSSNPSSSSNLPQTALTSDRDVGSSATVTKTGGLIGANSQSTSSSSSSRDSLRINGGRPRHPIVRGRQNSGGFKPSNGNGINGRPNLTATKEKDVISPQGTNKATGQRLITGPDGTKWVVDLEQGVLMNQDGQVLQDSQGKPKRVVLGEDGRTVFDHLGSPLVSQEGIALFGHGRESQPVVNPKDKVLMVGGKPVLGLDKLRPRTSSTTTTTTTTTTKAPTTTPEPTTSDWSSEEFTSPLPYPTCPPGTFSKIDEYGYPVVDPEGILDCYPEEDSSGMEMDHMLTVSTVPDSFALEKDELFVQPALLPTTTTTTTTTAVIPATEQNSRPSNHGPSSEFDLSGKKRFTAPYVNYIRKDPGAPCSLTEALEYLQVDILEDLMKKDSLAANQNQPPKNKPHNFTVVAMEGCHSFIILDWARPLKDDMVSGYMVYSASYDDVINNRWSSRLSNGTHLPVENLKPNSRYYFKVQAKNVFGLGPFSDTLTYVTESDDPLLIDRPPGGEPIWVPFSFKYNTAHSSCKGSQYVKRTWYRKFVGVVLCNSLRYKIFMGDGLREPFYSVGDTVGQGEDHCQFVDSHRDGRTGPAYLSNNLPSAQGFYRSYRQEPVTFGVIGRRTPHPFVGWYECGVPIPGKW